MSGNNILDNRSVAWLDRNLWFIPVLVTIVSMVCLITWSAVCAEYIWLASAKPSVRQQIYSSLASSSGSLLGFTIAAVTILAAFGTREVSDNAAKRRENNLGRARTIVNGSLLSTALLLLATLILSTVLIAEDVENPPPEVLVSVNLACIFGAICGLLLGGVGLTMTIIERNKNLN